MTREQEDRIIRQAQDILERRMGVKEDIKISLQNLVHYGAYYQGALDAVSRILPSLFASGNKPKGDDWVYLKAEWDLIIRDKRSMQLFLDGTRIAYRNHKLDRKGKLVGVEAYFVERRNVINEVK